MFNKVLAIWPTYDIFITVEPVRIGATVILRHGAITLYGFDYISFFGIIQ